MCILRFVLKRTRTGFASLPLLLVLITLVAAIAQAQGTGYWKTSGNQILDSNAQPVRIAGINWYGFETVTEVAHGLTSQDYRQILQTIKSNGYNTVRIPFSNQMVESPVIPSSISYSNGSGSINSDLQGLNSLQILDRIVTYCGTLGLRVILDDHRSEAGDSAEASGLWYTNSYPETAWINDWKNLTARYLNNPTVIGVDLRNEPHNAASGGACWDCGGTNDWHLAAERAGNAVLATNPNLLIFVEGTDSYNGDYYWWGGNLIGVKNSPVTLNISNHVVYSAHDYGPNEYGQSWFNSSTTSSTLDSVWTNHWAYISQGGIAPVWLGEFGTTNTSSDIQSSAPGSQGQWFQSLVSFLGSNSKLNWTYWALNGEDSYGLLDSNYDSTPASSLKQQVLSGIQFPLNGSGSGGVPPPTAPVAPTALAATPLSSTQINLSWIASKTTGVTYNVYANQNADFTPSSSNQIASGLTATSYSAASLAASTTYYFYAVASKSGLLSTLSNEVSSTTKASVSSASVCHVAYQDQNDWGGGFTGNIGITNTGKTAISNWILTWSWAGNQQITSAWNAESTQSGKNVSFRSESYNRSIPAGTTLTGIGFNANYRGQNSGPVKFYVNGAACQ